MDKVFILLLSLALSPLAEAFGPAQECSQFEGVKDLYSFKYQTNKAQEKKTFVYRTMAECEKTRKIVGQVSTTDEGTKTEVCGCSYNDNGFGAIYILPAIRDFTVVCYSFQPDGQMHFSRYLNGNDGLPKSFMGRDSLGDCEKALKTFIGTQSEEEAKKTNSPAHAGGTAK